MRINVTEFHIMHGTPKCGQSCAIAKAILDAIAPFEPYILNVADYYIEIWWRVTDDGVLHESEFEMPINVANWIPRFDAELTVSPISFDLPIDADLARYLPLEEAA